MLHQFHIGWIRSEKRKNVLLSSYLRGSIRWWQLIEQTATTVEITKNPAHLSYSVLEFTSWISNINFVLTLCFRSFNSHIFSSLPLSRFIFDKQYIIGPLGPLIWERYLSVGRTVEFWIINCNSKKPLEN